MSNERVCYVADKPERTHKPVIGVFNGKPRMQCQQCGQWLEANNPRE